MASVSQGSMPVKISLKIIYADFHKLDLYNVSSDNTKGQAQLKLVRFSMQFLSLKQGSIYLLTNILSSVIIIRPQRIKHNYYLKFFSSFKNACML